MNYRRYQRIISILFMLATALLSCAGPETQDAETSVESVEEATQGKDTTETIQQDVTEVASGTSIYIDGMGDDWKEMEIVLDDYVGDVEDGHLDLTEGYAFINQDAVYFLFGIRDTSLYYTWLSLVFQCDEKTYVVSFGPLDPQGMIGEQDGDEYNLIGELKHSTSAIYHYYEGRVDLRDLFEPNEVQLTRVLIVGGTGEDQFLIDDGDHLQPLVVIDEADVPIDLKEVSDEPPPEYWTFSKTYGEYIIRHDVQGVGEIAVGPNGDVYFVDSDRRDVVRLLPDGNTEHLYLWKVFDFGETRPMDIAFDSKGNFYISTHWQIFKYDLSSGAVEELMGVKGSFIGSITFNNQDELFYTDTNSRTVRKWSSPSSDEIVYNAGTFIEYGLAIDKEGSLYVCASDVDTYSLKRLVKINPFTGEGEIMISDLVLPEACNVDIDPEGDIWMGTLAYLYQVSPEGNLKPYTIDGETYDDEINWKSYGRILFDEFGNIWMGCHSSCGNVRKWESLSPGEADPDFSEKKFLSEHFSTKSVALDSAGNVYTHNKDSGEIIKITPDGEREVIKNLGVEGDHTEIAINDQDEIYLSLSAEGEIVRLENDGSLSHIADLYVNSMTFGADGNLYASTRRKPHSIVKITGVDKTERIVTGNIAGTPITTWEIELSPALDKGIYVLTADNSHLYFIDFDGNSELVADLGEYKTWVMAASPTNDSIFFISADETFAFTLVGRNPEGEFRKYFGQLSGDPWAMVVSEDGKWVYVGATGSVIKFPVPGGSQVPRGSLPANGCRENETLLYSEDFQDGEAQNWVGIMNTEAKNTGWTIQPAADDPDNQILIASNNTDPTVSTYWYEGMEPFSNAVWRIKVKFENADNDMFLNWLHWNEGENWEGEHEWRYIIEFGGPTKLKLGGLEVPGGHFSVEKSLQLEEGKWHFFEISTFNGKTEVWVDGGKKFDYTDPQPFEEGTIGLEVHTFEGSNSVYYIDDITVCGLSAPY